MKTIVITWIDAIAAHVDLNEEDDNMHFMMSAHPVIALIAGILILLIPRLLSYIIAIYLIMIGILGLVH
jgi:hypothetical protein